LKVRISAKIPYTIHRIAKLGVRLKIKYLSHACFELSNGMTILIDPYFEGNDTPDLVLVTHEHFDHGADAARFNCPKVCPPNCDYPSKIEMKIGDKIDVMGMPIEMISASHHQSGYPTGYVFQFEGKRIAHLGDTYIDGVSSIENVDILFVPIGGHFTMDIDEAIEALKTIRPKVAIPMHYNTFPEIQADPLEFKEKAESQGFSVTVIDIGQEIEE
jgi:L-ascorbate metabolism protein UlaG (beta-lactamase superfamily)